MITVKVMTIRILLLLLVVVIVVGQELLSLLLPQDKLNTVTDMHAEGRGLKRSIIMGFIFWSYIG